MNLLPGSSSYTRNPRESASMSDSLTHGERILYNLIHSKGDMGIWTGNMKRETNLPDNVVKKSLNLLQSKNLIKEVVNIQNRRRKHYMASEFEPSNEITGGDWYTDEGSFDTNSIKEMKNVLLKHLRQNVATHNEVLEWSRNSGVFTAEATTQQIQDILRTMVLNDEIREVKSTGFGDFASIPVGIICYKCKSNKSDSKIGAMASSPCGVCPRINFCTPDGIVSPRTCVYYEKWLDF